jgi:hypothetical protein
LDRDGLQFHVAVDAELVAGWGRHLPVGIAIGDASRRTIERVGRAIIGRFFDRAAA